MMSFLPKISLFIIYTAADTRHTDIIVDMYCAASNSPCENQSDAYAVVSDGIIFMSKAVSEYNTTKIYISKYI